jgi:DNA-binding MarR family transcriptional regulator
MTKSTTRPERGPERLERALEGLFRLGANRRFDARQAEVVGAEVTRAGYAVLRCLADAGTLGLRAVADACAMDGATASRQVGALVDDGLVDRRTAVDDARAIELSLTPRGHEVYRRIVDHRLSVLSGVIADWPDEDRSQLARLVERLTADLSNAPLPRT